MSLSVLCVSIHCFFGLLLYILSLIFELCDFFVLVSIVSFIFKWLHACVKWDFDQFYMIYMSNLVMLVNFISFYYLLIFSDFFMYIYIFLYIFAYYYISFNHPPYVHHLAATLSAILYGRFLALWHGRPFTINNIGFMAVNLLVWLVPFLICHCLLFISGMLTFRIAYCC